MGRAALKFDPDDRPPTLYFRPKFVEDLNGPGRVPLPVERTPPTIKFAISCMQDWRCYLCGHLFLWSLADATVEHVLPRARGGRNRHNRLLACRSCNLRKADRMPHPCEMLYLRAVNLWLAA